MEQGIQRRSWAGLCSEDNVPQHNKNRNGKGAENTARAEVNQQPSPEMTLSKEFWLELAKAKPCTPEKKVPLRREVFSRYAAIIDDDDTPLLDD